MNHGGHIANEVKLRGGKEYKKKLKEAREKRQELNYGDVLGGGFWEQLGNYLLLSGGDNADLQPAGLVGIHVRARNQEL